MKTDNEKHIQQYAFSYYHYEAKFVIPHIYLKRHILNSRAEDQSMIIREKFVCFVIMAQKAVLWCFPSSFSLSSWNGVRGVQVERRKIWSLIRFKELNLIFFHLMTFKYKVYGEFDTLKSELLHFQPHFGLRSSPETLKTHFRIRTPFRIRI